MLLSLLILNASSFSQSITKVAPNIGSMPPPLEFSQIVQGPNLNEISWDKLKGKVVVLEFWNIGCGPCIKAIPHLNDLVEQFSGKPVVFLSISDDNADRLKQFLQRRPIKSWLALDGPFNPTKTAFGIYGIPTAFIIDQSGTIVAITHPAKLESKHLEEILAGKPSSLPVPEPYADEDIRPGSQPTASSNSTPTEVTVSIQGPFPFPTNGGYGSTVWNKEHTVFEAKKAIVRDVLAEFFGVNRGQVMAEVKLPEGLYDITASAPPGQWPELRMRFAAMAKTNLGLSVQLTNRELDVYAMTLRSTNAPGLKRSEKGIDGSSFGGGGGFRLEGVTMDSVACNFEYPLAKPVVNETKLSGFWSVEVKWKMSEEELLPYQLDRKMNMLVISNPKAIISGDLPKELRDKISDHDLKLLQAELVKPDDQQFLPDPADVIKAAREQLGLEIKPAKRTLQVVEVSSVK